MDLLLTPSVGTASSVVLLSICFRFLDPFGLWQFHTRVGRAIPGLSMLFYDSERQSRNKYCVFYHGICKPWDIWVRMKIASGLYLFFFHMQTDLCVSVKQILPRFGVNYGNALKISFLRWCWDSKWVMCC